MIEHQGTELAGRVIRVEHTTLTGKRPRPAGSNARLGPHGIDVTPPITRITLDAGQFGFGWGRITPDVAGDIIGQKLSSLLQVDESENVVGVKPEWRRFDFPLWDLCGIVLNEPVYRLAMAGRHAESDETVPPGSLRVGCYDTTLYMDDLDIDDDGEAADLIAAEASDGVQAGHTAFKLKIGRGAMHMAPDHGMARDIRVTHAVRSAIGPDGVIMVDANDGFNFNLACEFLEGTADAGVYWLEEGFREDPVLYARLKAWMADRGLDILIADGEGGAAQGLITWAGDGLIDVIQYDLRGHTLSGWLDTGAHLDSLGVRSAPHNYGDPTPNYYCAHLAPAIGLFERIEWDQAIVDGLEAPGYVISGGEVSVPETPGFGLVLDEAHFKTQVAENGFCVE